MIRLKKINPKKKTRKVTSSGFKKKPLSPKKKLLKSKKKELLKYLVTFHDLKNATIKIQK